MKKTKNTGIYGINANTKIATPGNDLSKILKKPNPVRATPGNDLSKILK